MNKTILVVGLGNIGQEYTLTRHNAGFEALDTFVASLSEFSGWTNKKDLKSYISIGQLGDKRVIALKPTTLMNNSGEALALATHFYKVEAGKIIVVHDELDIDFGNIRTRIGGSSAGHNGIKSITKSLGTPEYGRVRLGIGPKKPARIDSADFVLQRFNEEEQAQLKNMHNEVTAILTEIIYSEEGLKEETRSFLV